MKIFSKIIIFCFVCILPLLVVNSCNTQKKRVGEAISLQDYITVDNTMSPVIFDSTFNTQSFEIIDSKPYGNDKSVDFVAEKGFKFSNPLKPFNLKLEQSRPESRLRGISYLDTNKLRVVYHL